ncbi:DUF938 domain-containing protein [Limibacillus halophilus]
MGGGFGKEEGLNGQDARLFSPSSQRNREPILEVLRRVLPSSGILLEVASGTGEHAAFMAPALSPLIWQPSDPDDAMRASIEAHVEATASPNLMPPLRLDVHQEVWPLSRADALVCCNMIHISPWSATEALLEGAAKLLSPGGILYLYGPYITEERPTAPSNLAFDEDLRRRNPEWGLRSLEQVVALAGSHGHVLEEVVEMPANNLSVVFRRS